MTDPRIREAKLQLISELAEACIAGDLSKVIEMLEKEPNRINEAMINACLVDQREIILYLLTLNLPINWDQALYYACVSGSKDLVELLIKMGAKNFNFGLISAAGHNQSELTELLIEKGADDLDHGLAWGCTAGHKDICNLIITRGAKTCLNCQWTRDSARIHYPKVTYVDANLNV